MIDENRAAAYELIRTIQERLETGRELDYSDDFNNEEEQRIQNHEEMEAAATELLAIIQE